MGDKLPIHVIHLPQRKDRWDRLENSIGKHLQHFQLIKHHAVAMNPPFGWIGCAKSHIQLIQKAHKHNQPFLIVLEDDAELSVSVEVFEESLKKLVKMQDYPVIRLSGTYSNMPVHMVYEDEGICVAQIRSCLTTVGTIYYNTSYDALIKLHGFYRRIGIQKHRCAWDIILNDVIRNYIVIPFLVIQSASYSDIERRMINYKRLYERSEKRICQNMIQKLPLDDRHALPDQHSPKDSEKQDSPDTSVVSTSEPESYPVQFEITIPHNPFDSSVPVSHLCGILDSLVDRLSSHNHDLLKSHYERPLHKLNVSQL